MDTQKGKTIECGNYSLSNYTSCKSGTAGRSNPVSKGMEGSLCSCWYGAVVWASPPKCWLPALKTFQLLTCCSARGASLPSQPFLPALLPPSLPAPSPTCSGPGTWGRGCPAWVWYGCCVLPHALASCLLLQGLLHEFGGKRGKEVQFYRKLTVYFVFCIFITPC